MQWYTTHFVPDIQHYHIWFCHIPLLHGHFVIPLFLYALWFEPSQIFLPWYLPTALFVVDAKLEKIAIDEAKILGIPVFGIVDTNTNPDLIEYPIPANDDSIKTVKLILNYFVDSINSVNLSKEEKVSTELEHKEKEEVKSEENEK